MKRLITKRKKKKNGLFEAEVAKKKKKQIG